MAGTKVQGLEEQIALESLTTYGRVLAVLQPVRPSNLKSVFLREKYD
jgi:hypothetical protein